MDSARRASSGVSRSRGLAFCAALWLAFVPRVWAAPRTAELALDADATCVEGAALRARAGGSEEWTLRAPPAPDAALFLAASVEPAAENALAVQLRVRWPDGRSGQRSLAAHSCEAALDALVLLVHMTLDAEPAPVGSAGVVEQVSVGASFGVGSGTQPGAAPGVGVLGALSFRGSGVWLPRLQLELSHAWRNDVSAEGGRADVTLDGGQLWLCPVGLRFLRAFAAHGCGVVELARLRARGYDSYAPRTIARPWVSVGVGALLSAALLARLELQLGAALLAPLWRDQLSFAPEVFYGVPAWRWQLKVGVALRFL